MAFFLPPWRGEKTSSQERKVWNSWADIKEGNIHEVARKKRSVGKKGKRL